MSATLDTTAGIKSTTGNGSATTFSLSITPSQAASSVYLIVTYESSFNKALSGTPTCGGTAMTEVATNLAGSDGSTHLRVFRIDNQPSSALTVSGAWNANGAAGNSPWQCIAFAANGTDTTNSLGAGGGTTTGFGADSLAITGASTSLNVAVIFGVANNGPNNTTVSPGTRQYDQSVLFTDNLWVCFQTVAGTGASQTMTFTPTTDDQGGLRTFEIIALASGNATYNATGSNATGTINSPTITANASYITTGVQATGSIGTATISIGAVNISGNGVQATGSIGTVSIATSASYTATSIPATGSIGTVTVSTGASGQPEQRRLGGITYAQKVIGNSGVFIY